MEYKKLGEIATYINGFAFKPEDRGTEGLPIIRIQDLTGNSYDLAYYDGEYPEKIEIDILFSVAISNDQTGTAPTTRISQLMFSFRKSNPSSIDATPNISIPDANIIGADIIEP